MTPKTLSVLAVAAIVSLIGAIAVYSANNQWTIGSVEGKAIAPNLPAQVDRITQFKIRQADETLTIVRADDGWRIKERDGYPANREKLRQLVVQLARAQMAEAKTRDPKRHTLLDLEDPAAKNSKARRVMITDAKGTALVDVIIGKERFSAFGSGKHAVYVRRPGEDQTWLASIDIDAPVAPLEWIDTKIHKLDAAKITRAEVRPQGGEPVVLVRAAGKEGTLSVENPPEGQKLKGQSELKSIVDALAEIDLEDVRKTATPAKDAKTHQAVVETRDGLKLTYRVVQIKDNYWLSASAAGTGKAEAEAKALNAKVSGWEFKLPAWRGKAILKPRADLFDKPKPAPTN